MANQISKEKLIHYLEWLRVESKFNAEEREANGMNSSSNRNFEKLSEELIEMIENGEFDD